MSAANTKLRVTFSDEWQEIDAWDFDDEALADGTPLRAVAKMVDVITGETGYYGVIEDEEDEI